MPIKLLIAVACWLSISGATPGGPGLTLTGKVVDSSGGPISNATVMVFHAGVKNGYSTLCPSCYRDCGKRTKTDPAGSYTLTKLDPDLWFQLLIVGDGYAPTLIKVDSSTGAAPAAVLPSRAPVSDPSRAVRGRVIDTAGNPVPDALVRSEGIDGENGPEVGTIEGLDPLAVSNDKGNFDLTYSKPAKKMLLSVEARTLAPKFDVLTTSQDRQVIQLGRGATIRGHLIQDGRPVANAEVGLIPQEPGGFGPQLNMIGSPYPEMRVGTQDDGSFVVSNVPTNVKWYVYAKMESVSNRGATEAKPCATTRPEEIVDVGELQLQLGHRFQGRVLLDDRTSLPEGMRVLITSDRDWDTQTAVLDRDGRFEFLNLPAGSYSISPAVRGYRLSDGQPDVKVSVEQDENDFRIVLTPNPNR